MAAKPLIVLSVFLWAGCANRNATTTVSIPRTSAVDATLGPNDVFEVRVFEEPDLSGPYRVDPSGSIDYPLIGKVDVTGKLPAQLASEIRQRLTKYVRAPQVSVLLKENNSKRVIVYGQVQHPGTFPYTDRMTVSQAISLAGGFTAMAARDRVVVSHYQDDKQRTTQIDLHAIAQGREANQFVQPGDEVFVPERLF